MTTPATLLVISDRASRGERRDASEAVLRPVVERAGFALESVEVVPDELRAISEAIVRAAARTALVLTTGGTGVAERDVTPEATRDVLELVLPGLGEEMRRRGRESTIKALGSRAIGGVRGRAVVLNLPGRPAGAVESFEAVAGALLHLVRLRAGPVPDASHDPEGA